MTTQINNMKRSFLLLGVVALITTTLLFMIVQQYDPWKVPEKYEKLKKPLVADESTMTSDKERY